MNIHINQAGSVANFIIVGIVLVVLTAGVIYAVRQKDTPTPESTPVATEPEKKTIDKPQSADTPATSETKPEQASSPATSTPAAETPVVPAPTVSTLSQTGPVDTTVQLIALGAIAVAGVSFVRSRSLRSSL